VILNKLQELQEFLNATLTYTKLLIIGRTTNDEALENDGGEQGLIVMLGRKH
jgi:hypothetical protein